MTPRKQWSLGAKLALVASPFLALALLSIALTLWVSWQLEGGAAAVNEAGRMRMQAYRMALSVGTAQPGRLPEQVSEFDRSLVLLRQGDPERPLFVPWDDDVRGHFASVERDWAGFQARWIRGGATADGVDLNHDTAAFAAHVDALVHSIETHMSRWTALLHLAQLATMALAVIGTSVLVYTGYLFVLEPVGTLKQAIRRMQEGDFSTRVERVSSDEFGTLAEGFNGMAGHVQSMYQHLECRVAEKTAELQEKRERLEALYSVTSLVGSAATLQDLAQGFVQRVRTVARADGAALRWSDESNERYLILAAEGLPAEMQQAEHCVQAGDCHCGNLSGTTGLRVIPIREAHPARMPHCARAGFETIVSIPIRVHERLMGELDLFYHAQCEVGAAERSLLEALGAHLAAAMDNIRLLALEKEAAVSQERSFIARELHDSIAQSLAFLKIQVQLMQEALDHQNLVQAQGVLLEIGAGVRESYADVRELLVHFRTRASSEDIEPALLTTLRKFEQQTGMPATLQMEGSALPLAPDRQIQVLHILQEALSNVRKHAGATQVWLDVQQQPQWRFEVRDNGHGFDAQQGQDETHVGLRIMTERAQRIGGHLEVLSRPGHGTSVLLTLAPEAAGTPPLPAAEAVASS
ncbi:MAG: type IV pili methyl-accepting chemotaxis transducer N-terminal domain-containing protein [Rhodoferax sp.]|nr:type IV pili methyl-accepting chemotaxis transducer N-terminal domain-containing protein [Rhodoferax sp.]